LGLQAGCHVRSRTTPASPCHKTEKGFLEALKGSTTERALRETRCQLLAVPVPEALA